MSDLTQYFGGQEMRADDPNLKYEDYGPITPGEYPVEVSRAEVKKTKAGTGAYVEIELTIIGDASNGRKVWHRCNISNPNPKAVEIGMKQLAEVGRALGVLAIRNTDQIVGKYCKAKVIVKDGQNEVKGFRSYAESSPRPQDAQMPAPPTPATTTAQQPMPWANSAQPNPANQNNEPPF